MEKIIENLPPYGYTLADNQEYLDGHPVPRGFDTQAAWDDWKASLVDDMKSFLWPVWVDGVGWDGAAKGTAIALTEADLALLQEIQQNEAKQPIAGTTDDGSPILTSQMAVFRDEDDKPPFRTFEYYSQKIPHDLKADVASNIVIGGRDIARVLSQELKSRFQRPRPSQVGQWWYPDIRIVVQRSVTAVTPAMIAGHPIQGCLAYAQVLSAMGNRLPANVAAAIGRFLLDTGDRRVYAGLHYPSDIVGSWYAGLAICLRLFGKEISTRLFEVMQGSPVYQAIAAKRKTVAVYDRMLGKLEALGAQAAA